MTLTVTQNNENVNKTSGGMKLNYAKQMLAKGLAVFPISWSKKNSAGEYICSCGDENCKHHGKHPLLGSHGFKDSTLDPDMIEWNWMETPDANIGVHPGKEFVLIDIDRKTLDKNGEIIDGLTSLAEFMGMSEEKILQQTYTVRTPTGGFHLYLSCDVDDRFGNRVGMLPGIDVRGNDGYVVGPGSMIRGNFYEDFNGLDIAPVPDCLRTIMTQARVRDEKAQDPIGELDTPTNIEQAKKFLAKTEPAVEGQGGNDWAFKTVCKVKDCGISEDKCFNIMMLPHGWNNRCEPPWDTDELKGVINNAYRYGKDRPGSQSCQERARVFDCVVGNTNIDLPVDFFDLSNTNDNLAIDPITMSNPELGLLDGLSFIQQVRSVVFIAQNLLRADGFTALLAERGSGKTTFLVDLIMRLINDMDWYNGHQLEKGWSVLFIAAEDDIGVQAMMKGWLKEHGKTLDEKIANRLQVLPTAIDLLDGDAVENLIKKVKIKIANPDKTLVIVDTWQRVTANAESQSNEKDMQNAIRNVEMMAKAFSGPVIGAFHPPKGKGKAETILGSSVLENANTCIWNLTGTGVVDRTFKVTRLKGGPEIEYLKLSPKSIFLGNDKKGQRITTMTFECVGGTKPGEVSVSTLRDAREKERKKLAQPIRDFVEATTDQPSVKAVAERLRRIGAVSDLGKTRKTLLPELFGSEPYKFNDGNILSLKTRGSGNGKRGWFELQKETADMA